MPEKSRTPAALLPWLSLLVACILINQIDRVNLAVAAPLLKDEFHLNPWQPGILFSAFFWTYAGAQPVIGWLTDRFEVNVVLAAGFLLWSLATVATGLVNGFAMLLVTRLMLGIGESAACCVWTIDSIGAVVHERIRTCPVSLRERYTLALYLLAMAWIVRVLFLGRNLSALLLRHVLTAEP